MLQEAPGGATTFSFDCAAGPADGEYVTLECTDRAGDYSGAPKSYRFSRQEQQSVPFPVSKQRRVDVLVEDGATKLPIAGARVELASGKTVLGTAETDAGGRTRFLEAETPGIAGEMDVRCAAKGYAAGTRTVVREGEVTVALTQAAAREMVV